MQFTLSEKKYNFTFSYWTKIVFLLSFCLGTLLALLIVLSPQKAFADTYTSPQTTINAQVTSSGDIVVSQQQTFVFTADTPYIKWTFANLPTGSTMSIKNVSLAQGSVEGSTSKATTLTAAELQQVPSGFSALSSMGANVEWRKSVTQDNLPSGQCYSYDSPKNTLYVFLGATNQTYTLTINYVLENGVQIYQDIADMQWRFIPVSGVANSENVKITTVLPVPSNAVITKGSTIRGWSHGSADVSFSISDKGIVSLSLNSLNKNNYAEERVIFPAEWITSVNAEAQNAHLNTSQLDSVLAQERSWSDSETYWTSRTYGTILGAVLIAVLVIALGIVSARRFKKEIKADFNEPYWYKKPNSHVSSPTISRLLNSGKATPDDFVVSVMNLVSKGIIRVEQGDDPVFVMEKGSDYVYINDLHRKTADLIFGLVGQGSQRVALSEIKAFAQTHKQEFKNAYELWEKDLSSRVDNANLFENYRDVRYPRLIAIALFDIIALIICFLICGNVLALIPGIVAYLVVLLALYPLGRVTKTGAEALARLEALDRWFKNLPKLNHSALVDSTKLWSDFYMYAYLLGDEQMMLSNLAKSLPEGYEGEDAVQQQQACKRLRELIAGLK